MKHAEALEEMERLVEALKKKEGLSGERYWTLEHLTDSRGETKIKGYIALPGLKGHGQTAWTYAGAIENVRAMLGLVESDSAPEDGTNTSRPNPIE